MKFIKENKKNLIFLFVACFFIIGLLFFNTSLAKAQLPVTDGAKIAQDAVKDVKDTAWNKLKEALKKAGSVAYQRTLSKTLNKIAYDAANYIGSGAAGQKKLFQDLDIRDYAFKMADEAAGTFVESFVRNINRPNDSDSCEARFEKCKADCYERFKDEVTTVDGVEKFNICMDQCKTGRASCEKSPNKIKDDGLNANDFNICQPSSVEVKLKMSLGLVEQQRPSAPNCTATRAINNWGDSIENQISSIKNMGWTSLASYFDPRANDLGIYFNARTDLSKRSEEESKSRVDETLASGGWIDVRSVGGVLQGTPGSTMKAEAEARDIRIQNFGKTTGDIFVDAANLFLNQLAVSAYSNLMKNLNDKRSGASQSLTDPSADSNLSLVFGESRMREKTMTILESRFESDREMSVLSELVVCTDPNNPGPNNCVIDDRFMQAIIEQKTVAQAIKDGDLNPNWRVEKDFFSSAYNNHYSLRNIKILRKHRILPIGWELAIERAFEDESKPRYATLGDLISCFSKNDEYNSFSTNFDVSDNLWCEGLVDPNWLLKAPLSYCKQSGSGSHILNMAYIDGLGSESKLILMRSDDYCADNQTCIKENRDGGCDVYGYCTEDRRTWKFESNSCSPLSNTCQSFVDSKGNTVSYLENTINYSSCNADSSGCGRFSLSGLYNENGSISWNFSKNLFFNKNIISCNSSNEGCSELIRVKPTWGANLIFDSGFNNVSEDTEFSPGEKIGSLDFYSSNSTSLAKIVDTSFDIRDFVNGDARAAKLSGLGNVSLRSSAETFPENLQILKNQNYTLSADVLLVSGDRLELQLNPGDRQSVVVVNDLNSWNRVSITANSASGLSYPSFSFSAFGAQATFYVKNIKFELGDWATSYSDYGSRKISQKILPSYLESTCYEDVSSASKNYSLKEKAPSVCFNYARKCNYDEVGCELFTSNNDNFSIPAQVSSSDYCPGECVGYDVYIAKENYFNSTKAQNLIPSEALKCSQSAVGCTEFTNLDEVSKGGEGIEYYSELRQCIKPDSSKCANFYTWDGSSGLEIKTYSLQKDSQGNPLIKNNKSKGDCSDIYGLPINDPRYNPDCKEFRNNSGQLSYRLSSSLITCSDNCFNYRMNELNIDPFIKSASDCVGIDKKWNNTSSVCYSCLNGGVWDNNQNACVYQAIPNEGRVCQANQVSCSEYNGSMGNNSRSVYSNDFEQDLGYWQSECNNGISLSKVANNRNGSSLFYSSSASSCTSEKEAKLKIGININKDKSYTLRFLARSSDNNLLKIYFKNEESGKKYYFNSIDNPEVEANSPIKGGNKWSVYNFNLSNVPDSIGINGTLNISATHDFYIDDILLTEISDRYYLLKNSIKIPDICYYDNLGKYQGADYNLGCYQYSDRSKLKHNLHNFSSVCSDSSVGCEQMIFTQNYKSPLSGIWNDENENGVCDNEEKDCLTVSRDESVYVVYDQGKSCLAEDVGCSRMGEGLGTGLNISWSDTFKINNPNRYENILCSEDDLGCQEYRNLKDGSLSYFVNPINNVCVYRSSKNQSSANKSWYKMPVKRCDLNKNGIIDGSEMSGPICSIDSDCSSSSCILDQNDYECSVSYLKTIGYGGINSAIPIPDKSVAMCDISESGCTEYIDPVSSFNPNIVRNPSFESSVSWGIDSWLGSQVSANSQVVNFERNKLYSFSKIDNASKKNSSGASLNFVGPVRILQENNSFSEALRKIDLNTESNGSYVIFNSLENYSALLTGGEKGKTIEIRELAVSYNIKNELDSGSCSGIMDFDNGCVLFNERSVVGASGLKNNNFSAHLSSNGKSPFSSFGPYNANQLIKVKPDRTCAKWLTCTSYTIENDKKLCSSLAECNLLDDKNECANYISRPAQESFVFNPEINRNATGYSLLGNYYFNNIKEVGLNTRARYDFEESIPSLSCVASKQNGEPTKGVRCVFDKNIISDSLVREPAKAGVDYPASGLSLLKVSPGRAISPQPEGTYVLLPEPGDYYLSYLVNTKNSNTSAVATIVNYDSYNTITRSVSASVSGWERKIHKFRVDNKNTRIRIYLSSVRNSSSGSVYFDDVNIETVLQVGEDKYSARDCRLYPNSSSFSCQDIQNNIIRNGVEGYCLEYDLANPDVCQLWMPVERISPAKINNNQSGYDGKYPLSYCAEVSSNFILLEKRSAAIVRERSLNRNSSSYLGVRECFYPGEVLGYCRALAYGDDEFNISLGDESAFEFGNELNVVVDYNTDQDGKTSISINQVSTTSPTFFEKVKENFITGKIIDQYNPSEVQRFCGNSGNYFFLRMQDLKQENGAFKRDEVGITEICVPINKLNYYSDRPTSTVRYVPSKDEPITTFVSGYQFNPTTNGWYVADGFHSAAGHAPTNKRGGAPEGFDELFNADPPLRVLDLNLPIPSGEDSLKKISSNNPDEVFRLTCNKFVEVVSGGGENMAWVQRVNQGSSYKIEDVNGISYNNYVRKIGDIPFGASSWPNNFSLMNSERVPLYNQYSAKNKEDIFAGRPYGCDTSNDNSLVNCTRIGYCSANPDVYCLLDSGFFYDGSKIISTSGRYFGSNTYDIARQSCGSWGTCMPLWSGSLSSMKNSLNNYSAPLSQLFLQAPVAYEFRQNEGGYVSVAGYFSSVEGSNPELRGVKLYSGGKEHNSSGIKAGVYRLDFFTSVSGNQQPLREIFIDWGDGFKQIVTGQDSRENDQPHSFYHYYSNARNSVEIRVKVYDNWGKSSNEFILRR